jgi:ribosomal protein S18 acetylase RimI-like enzyme
MHASVADPSVALVEACLAAECARWQNHLGWDLTRDWRDLSAAWQSGHVRVWYREGREARDATWAFAVPTHSALQVGAVIAPDAVRYAALVRELTAEAGPLLGFVREQRSTDAHAWIAHGCEVDRSVYLVAAADGSGSPIGRPLAPMTDRDALVQVCREAYASATYLRAFAPDGTTSAWAAYVDGLLTRPGCGDLQPEASVVVEDTRGMIGACLVSVIGPAMAHLPQLVVAPRAAGQGVGAALVRTARSLAATQLRCAAVSLIVSESNERAGRLYAREGFHTQGAFLTIRRA